MEFEWDNGNLLKSLAKHGITPKESEEVFIGQYIMVIDEIHSTNEVRFKIIGHTKRGKLLTVVFTTRYNRIRVISARIASKKERGIYEEKKA